MFHSKTSKIQFHGGPPFALSSCLYNTHLYVKEDTLEKVLEDETKLYSNIFVIPIGYLKSCWKIYLY